MITRATARSLRLPTAATAAAMLCAAAPASAQTTPCDAIFEPVLAAGVAEAERHLQAQWTMIDGAWVAAYRLEGETMNPLDPRRLREQLTRRPAEQKLASPPAKAAPLPPITGFATARDVRCNAGADSARPDVMLVFSAAGVRFQEGKGPWSAVIPDAAIAVVQLRRAGGGWSIVDRTAERGVMPPDARRTPPPSALARKLASEPWQPQRNRRRTRRG